MTMGKLKEAVEYETYAEYCAPRRELGLGVIPESLYNALVEQEEELQEAADAAHLKLVQQLAGKVC